MEAAVQSESLAVEVRERLAGFVLEVAERLPLRRQRENWAESRNSDGGLQAACACWSVSSEYRCWGVW